MASSALSASPLNSNSTKSPASATVSNATTTSTPAIPLFAGLVHGHQVREAERDAAVRRTASGSSTVVSYSSQWVLMSASMGCQRLKLREAAVVGLRMRSHSEITARGEEVTVGAL